MLLALAVLLIQPQMQAPLSVNVSKLESAAAESSALATAGPNAANSKMRPSVEMTGDGGGGGMTGRPGGEP